MAQIEVKILGETNITYKQLADLLHAAFEERLEQGLNFTCSTMTAEQFEEKMRRGTVFVAIDTDNQELLGTVTIHINKDNKGNIYGYHEYLAVSPKAKHSGVATKLAKAWNEYLLEKKAKYVMSDTACGATSSVNWHRKNGFKIIGLRSYGSTNYYSYLFRKQLMPSKIWNNNMYCSMRFHLSSIVIKAIYRNDGTLTKYGIYIKKIIKR